MVDNDKEHKRFTVIVKDTSTNYTLMRPEGSDVCILAVGDLRSVNITESWFGTVYVKSSAESATGFDGLSCRSRDAECLRVTRSWHRAAEPLLAVQSTFFSIVSSAIF